MANPLSAIRSLNSCLFLSEISTYRKKILRFVVFLRVHFSLVLYLLDDVVFGIEEEHDWGLARHLLKVGDARLVALLEVFEDEFLHLRKTVQFSSGARLDAHLGRRPIVVGGVHREGQAHQEQDP